MMEVIGWVGAISFAICSYPQVYKTWRTKSSRDLSFLFLITWFVGEVCTWVYVAHGNYLTGNWQWPLHFNYFFNFLGLVYLLWAKIRYTDKGKKDLYFRVAPLIQRNSKWLNLSSTPNKQNYYYELYIASVLKKILDEELPIPGPNELQQTGQGSLTNHGWFLETLPHLYSQSTPIHNMMKAVMHRSGGKINPRQVETIIARMIDNISKQK
jgi:uncharacterized protein with PQ loop repeat